MRASARRRDHRIKYAGSSGAGFPAISPRDPSSDLTRLQIEIFTSVLFCDQDMIWKFEIFRSNLKFLKLVMSGSSHLLRNVTKFWSEKSSER